MFLTSLLRTKHQHKLLTTLLLSALFSVSTLAQTWELVGVSSGGISPSWGSFQNLVHDNNGNLYCSFYDGSVTKGSVMKFDGTSWSYLGGAGITPGTATYSSLACASDNSVFYSHQLGYPASGISVQKYNGTSWTTLPSAESATVNFQSITTNASNQPIVAYASGGNLKVKAFDGTAWNVLGTNLPSGLPYYLDLKCVNDTVYAGFVNSGMKIYKIAASASATDSWIEVGTTSFSATSSEQFRSAIAVDNNNDVYAAFTSLSAAGNKINVKKYDHLTQQWSDVGSQNFSAYRVHYIDIALDNNHTPYVAYSHFENSPNNKNYVLKFDGTDWVSVGNTEVSDQEAKWNSLIVLAGKPILAYSDETADVTVVKEFIDVTGCTNTLPGTATGSTGCITFNYQQAPVTYTTVRAADGNVWLQQNLGSSQVAVAANDASAYGDYFQWGRWDNGHQLTSSTITATPPNPNDPSGLGAGTANFYSAGYSNGNNWWYNGTSTDTWAGSTPADVSATNGCDPCKAMGAGWRLPTTVELTTMMSAENITNLNSAFASNLKIVGSGMRDYSGMFVDGTRAYLWSGTASSVSGWGETVYISPNVALSNYGGRDGGMPLRCIYSTITASGIEVNTQNNVAANITTQAGTLQMVATIQPSTVSQAVTWSIVPASGSATISSTGLVTAQTNGTVWAKAVSVANTALADSMEITISGQVVLIMDLDVQTLNNVAAVITTNAGTLQMEAVITPSNTTNQNVTWSLVNGTGSAMISTTGLVTAQTNGTVWAKAVSDENPNVKDSLLVTLSGQNSAGIVSQSQGELRCYPNPVETLLNVVIPETITGNAQAVLIDLSGKIVFYQTIDNNQASLNLESVQAGSYILRIQTPRSNYSHTVQVY
ncbi:T9SS type A sorting domain-containing protein [Fluviicola sp.]|uniref:T9SS type A sorting domain-containing protein n=1 Tax=Fluviicola sp. TaxID=1917219 RepID=UPI0031DB951C